MAVIHITEEEAAKNLKSVLARAELGEDIAIDGSNSSFRLVPSTRKNPTSGTEILKMFAALPGERGIMDEDFARDVRSFREGHPESLDSSKWD